VNVSPSERAPYYSRVALIRLWIAVLMVGALTAFVSFVMRPHRWEPSEVPAAPREGSHAG
jgi:hypothetical protein